MSCLALLCFSEAVVDMIIDIDIDIDIDDRDRYRDKPNDVIQRINLSVVGYQSTNRPQIDDS